jgi:hypothetical protein
MNPLERLGDALAELEEPNNPIVFKEDTEWVVLSFAPFERRVFPSWKEAYAHAYTVARIPFAVIETIQECSMNNESEREALAEVVYYWDVSENVGSKAWDQLAEGQRDVWRSAADVVLAAGFRRQWPITAARPYSESTDIAHGAWETDDLEEFAMDLMAVVVHRRAALEAARDAS